MKQNYFLKAICTIAFSLMVGFFSAQNANVFYTPSGFSIQKIKVTKSNNNIYVMFNSQSGGGFKVIGSNGADLASISGSSANLLADDSNGNLYFQVTNTGDIYKLDVQNGNTVSNFYTTVPPAQNMAVSGNTLFTGSMSGVSYVSFTGNTASAATTLYAPSQSTPDSPGSMYAHGGFLYLMLSNYTSNTSKVVKYDVSNLSASPVDVATGIPTTQVGNLCVDSAGKVYYRLFDATLNRYVLDRYTPGSGANTIDDGRNGNFLGIDVDVLGNVYYTAYNAATTPNQLLYRIDAATLSTQAAVVKTFSVFPNPAKDFVTVSNVGKGAEIGLYDITGKLLYSTKANGTSVTLNTSAYQNGVYVLRVNGQASKLLISK